MNIKDIPPFDDLLSTFSKTLNTVWNIHHKIHQPIIDRWLDNFSGEALQSDTLSKTDAAELEKQLALFLLCNFVYYNESEVKYLTKVMFGNYLHNIFSTKGKSTIDDDNINELLNKTQFSFLGQSSESSSYLLYHFRQENDLPKNNFIVSNKTENIVFIDDFSISGTQAIGYLDEYFENNPSSIDRKIFMLIMISTETAINELKNNFNNVTVLPCIIMDDRSKSFSDSSIIFDGYKDEIKQQAKRMCEFYGKYLIDLSDNKMTAIGYGGDGYLFGSYYNIPDNTLPIFWSDKNNWHYLFKRYNKNYGDGINIGGRYV